MAQQSVRELLTRSLRLINEPGKGMDVGDEALNDAFEVFLDIIYSQGVSRFLRPGIRTHFFNVNSQQHVYTYGPGGDFDTDLFNDMVPVAIESAYLRAGDTIQTNELITNGKFNDGSNDWTVGSGWSVLNAEASFDQSIGDSALTQAFTWVPGTVYIIKFDITVDAGGGTFTSDGGAFTTTFSSSGTYEFEYTATASSSSVQFESLNASGDEYTVDSISIIEKNKNTVELVNNTGRAGSDYPIRIIDQNTYNREFSKATGGRPEKLLYSRSYPLAEVKFDQLPTFGEVIIMDVTTVPIHNDIDSELLFYPDSYKYLRYQIADDIAPEYGKALTQRQQETLRTAKRLFIKGNKRQNTLRTDRALLGSRRYNINQGDY